jgi:hypothetical protein
MKKNLLLLGVLVAINFPLIAQTVSIGTPDNYTYTVFNMQDPYTRHAAIYSLSEIGTTGTITSLGWNLKDVWSNGDGPVKIYLKEDASFLNSDSWATLKTGATLVYDGTVTFPLSANNDWFTIPLATSFAYSSGNLLVMVESNYGGTGNGGVGGDIDFNTSTEAPSFAEFWWGDPVQTTGTSSANRPILQITFGTTTGQDSETSTINEPFLIFPNPALQSFNYSMEGIGAAELSIYNMEGKQVYTEKTGDAINKSIDISFLPKGCYVVGIRNDRTNVIEKLIIQ